MKRFSSRVNDERIADDANNRPAFMCKADRCPNRWSVSTEIGEGARGTCSRHARIDEHLWPIVTREILDDMAEDARRAAASPNDDAYPMPKADRERLIAELRKLATPNTQGPRDWAHRLKARDEAGEKLTPAQRECYRGALRDHFEPKP